MKRISALFTSFLITILVMLLPYVVMAATPVNVSVSKNEVKPGDTVTVIVGANVSLGTFNCTIKYDSSRMEFLPSSSTTNVSKPEEGRLKAVFVTMGGSDVSGNGMFTLVFKAKSLDGSAVFIVDEAIAANYAGDSISFSGGSNSVSVKSDAAPPVTLPNTIAPTAPPQPPLTTVETIAPTTADPSETEETKSQPTKVLKAVDHKGRRLSIPDIDLEDADIPSGFEAAERVIDGSGLSGYYSETEDLFLSFLSLSGQEPQLYFYNSSSKSFIPYLRFKLGDEYYHVTLMPDELIPYGTTRSDAEIREVNLPVIEFNFGDYVSFDEYMKQYQAELSKSGPAASLSGQTDSTAGGDIAKMDIEIDREKAATYLLALVGGNKEIERFLYSQTLDQLMHYDLLLVPAFGTFLDEDFDNLAQEDPQGAAMQTETVTSATEIVGSDLNEGQQGLRSRTVKLFGRDIELWQIIAASGGVLLILILLIIIIIKLNSDRKKAEYPFADDFLADDNVQRAEEDSFKASDEAEAANIPPVSYNYLTDLSEVRDVPDIGVKAEQSIGKAYQKKSKGNERFSTYAYRSDPEDQEEI
jgi:hypothetical protein